MKRALFIAGLLVLLAAGVRGFRLGQPSLDFDEYLHVLPAQAWTAQGAPLLPSGIRYGRALPFTWLVRETMDRFGASEAAARLPAALAGLVLVGLVGWIAARWWGVGAGLLALAVMAFDPSMVQMSRVCRMYGLFHLAYLAGCWALFECWEGPARLKTRAAWFLLALGAFVLAWRLHKLWMEAGLSIAVFVLWQALARREKRYLILAGAGLAGVAAVVALDWVQPMALWQRFNQAPEYAAPWRYDYLYYVRAFWRLNPLLMLSVLPALWWAARAMPARGRYLTCLVGVPLVLHALIFDLKETRYVLHLVPLAAVAVGAAWAAGIRTLAASTRGRAALGTALVVVYALLGTPRALALQGLDGDVAAWREAYAQVGPQMAAEDALIISVPLVSHYYLKRAPDYVMLNVLIKDAGRQAERNAEGWYVDGYSGKPLITTPEEITQVFARHAQGWIIVDAARYPHETCVPATVRAVIAAQAQPWPSPDPSVLIFRWGAEHAG